MRGPITLLALCLSTTIALGIRLSPPLDVVFSENNPDAPGYSAPVNCTPTAMADTWTEMTDIGVSPFKQYKNKDGEDLSDVPDPLPMPFLLTASDNRAPGWESSCISKSPSAPADCEGDACNVYIEEWNVSWVEFAELDCMQSYPTANLTSFFDDPTPPAGNVSLTVTNQCKNYYYGPDADGGAFFYQMTDRWGNKWALQTSQQNLTTEDEWDAWLAEIQWPPGFTMSKIVLTETETHAPWIIGDGCYWNILKDNLFNSWHQFTYPDEGPASTQSLLGQMQTCQPLTVAYTAEGLIAPEVQASKAPAPAPGLTTVSKTSSGAAALGAGTMAAAALAAAALLLA